MIGTLNVVVNGRVVDQYKDGNKVFIEGRKGSEYTIRYHNNTSNRVKVVLSVDGLNVISGDNDWSQGYVVEPWGSIEVPGWRKDENNTAHFEFSSTRGSYNQHNDLGQEVNIGVIGAKVFYEQPKFNIVYHNHYINPNPIQYDWNWGYVEPSITRGFTGKGTSFGGVNNNIGGSMNCSFTAGGLDSHVFMAQNSAVEPEVQSNNLGTGWGKNQEFKTHTVHYDFNSYESEVHVLYYDDLRGLQDRGINLKKKVRPTPNAFPKGPSCPPPRMR